MMPDLASLQNSKLECRDVQEHHLESLAPKCMRELLYKPSSPTLRWAEVTYSSPLNTASLGQASSWSY